MNKQLSLLDQSIKQAPLMPESKVFTIRGVKVMLDKDVAEALGTEAKRINENAKDSPKWDYLRQNGLEELYRFRLTENDLSQLGSEIPTISDIRYLPWVYTRKGCAYFGTSMTTPEACAQAVSLVEVFDAAQELKKPIGAKATWVMVNTIMAQLVEQEERAEELAQAQRAQQVEIRELQAHNVVTNTDHYTIAGFASLMGLNLSVRLCIPLGKKATKISNDDGYTIGKTHSEQFGQVNCYHVDVLMKLFEGEKLIKTRS